MIEMIVTAHKKAPVQITSIQYFFNSFNYINMLNKKVD